MFLDLGLGPVGEALAQGILGGLDPGLAVFRRQTAGHFLDGAKI